MEPAIHLVCHAGNADAGQLRRHTGRKRPVFLSRAAATIEISRIERNRNRGHWASRSTRVQQINLFASGPGLDSRIKSKYFSSRHRGRHIEQRTYGISTGTGCFERSVILLSRETCRSNATSETATPSEHAAIKCIFDPSSCNDLTVHF